MDYTPQQELTSIDLTEDEDSRETIVDSEIGNWPYNFEKQSRDFPMKKFSANSPPPLKPIPRFDSIERPKDHRLYNVPKLTKIQRRSTAQQTSSAKKVRVISSTVIKPPLNTVSLEDAGSKLVQSEMGNHVSIISCSLSQNPPGKLLKIMKNKKMYEYVIPHNVMPMANQSAGPVLLNIPEVGSIVISIDPHSRSQVVPKNVQLEPFSLNFDEIIEASDRSFNSPNSHYALPTQTSTNTGMIGTPYSHYTGIRQVHTAASPNKSLSKASFVHDEILTDKKFCWQYSKTKRKEQRVLKNMLGFSKVEVRNTKKCSTQLHSHIYEKHCQLLKKKVLLESFKTSSTGNGYSLKDSTNEIGVSVPTHVPEWLNEFDKDLIQNNNFDDLLVTKKIVILNEENREMPELIPNLYSSTKQNHKSKRKKTVERRQFKEIQKYTENGMKPCYIKMMRNPNIDKMYDDLKRKMNSSKKVSLNSKSPKKLMSYEKMFLSKLIDTKHKFRTEMAFIKPVLVLNESNFTIVKYSVEFSKSNIVFAVNQDRYFPNRILHDHSFVSAVEVGYVKLVDADILCSYFMGELGPWSPKRLDDT